MPSHGDPRRTDDGAYSLVQDDSVARGQSGHGVVLLESSSRAHMSVPSAFERPSLVLLTRIERVIQESRVLNDLEEAAASDAARQAVAHTRRGLVRAVRVLRNPAAHSNMTFVALAVTCLEMVSLKKAAFFLCSVAVSHVRRSLLTDFYFVRTSGAAAPFCLCT